MQRENIHKNILKLGVVEKQIRTKIIKLHFSSSIDWPKLNEAIISRIRKTKK